MQTLESQPSITQTSLVSANPSVAESTSNQASAASTTNTFINSITFTLDKQTTDTAYLNYNSKTNEITDFTYDPITGVGVKILDQDKNNLADSFTINIIDGGLGDEDGLKNGSIVHNGFLGVAPRGDVYRFFNAKNGNHLYTNSISEKDTITGKPEWGYNYEGIAYKNLVSQGTSLYRFYNSRTNAHFYTTSGQERDNVISHPEWKFSYEGEAYKVSIISQFGMSTPVHRFYNTNNGTHFYTSSEAEKTSVISNLTQYNYEGVSWYI